MKIRILIVLTVWILGGSLWIQGKVYSQGSREELINAQLSQSDRSKIKRLEKDENEAMRLMKISDSNFENLSNISLEIDSVVNRKKRKEILKKAKNYEIKAIKNRVASLKLINDTYVQRFIVLKSDLKKFFPTADKPTLDSALALQKLASAQFESAELDTDRAFYTINQPDLFQIFTRAYQAERIGLLYQQKMYALFLKWDKFLVESIDEELLAFLSKEPTQDNQNVKIMVSIIDSLNIKTVVVYDTVWIEQDKAQLVFKVQIAASKKEMSKNELKRIYAQDYMIVMDKEGPWYKYSVGAFADYIEAQKFKINTGVRDAFIVAWKNGKKVHIKEALMSNK
jgi:hypothetical protein